MKKIIPFNNVLEFQTDVREITAISLEHEINKYPDTISGTFYISGEYKITEGILDREKFNFELPFDIALSENYKIESLIVDIDDFRYNLISEKSLKVNIDLYIDGEIEEPTIIIPSKESLDFLNREEVTKEELITTKEIQPERINLLQEMLTDNKEESMEEKETITNENNNENNNFLDLSKDDAYVTYRVYKVLENDTLDTILEKYNITKEMLSDYNNIENIIPGDKLIIPTNEK